MPKPDPGEATSMRYARCFEYGLALLVEVSLMPGLARGERTQSPDAVLAAISHSHRRIVLRTLQRAEEAELHIDRLADAVGNAAETPADAVEFDSRIRVALHHVHLPKLAAAGLIEYDTATNRVTLVADELRAALLAVVADEGT